MKAIATPGLVLCREFWKVVGRLRLRVSSAEGGGEGGIVPGLLAEEDWGWLKRGEVGEGAIFFDDIAIDRRC